MARRRSNWEETAQFRFLRWMRQGVEPLDPRVEASLEETSDTPRSDEELRELEVQRETLLLKRQAEVLRMERQLYGQLQTWTGTRGRRLINRLYALLAVLVCGGIIFVLFHTVNAMPLFGDPAAPANNEVVARYIEKGVEETGAVNLVAGIILDYRAFDTLGESTVLFISACAVLILLRIGPDRREPGWELIAAEADDRHHEPRDEAILQGVARVLVPVVMLFGIYVILNGHLSPGGGFSGGAIVGAGLVLYLNAFGFQRTARFFTQRTFAWVSFVSLMFYALIKAYSFYCGANGLPSGIPLGSPGDILSAGLILPLNIAVGMVVACTMYAFFALFRKGSIQ